MMVSVMCITIDVFDFPMFLADYCSQIKVTPGVSGKTFIVQVCLFVWVCGWWVCVCVCVCMCVYVHVCAGVGGGWWVSVCSICT